jgi:FAD/FMN-containing dehydrogenase
MQVIERVTTLNGGEATLDEAALEGFAASLRGALIRPNDAAYDEARQVWNGLIDKRPALIARCAGTADVVECVRFASEHDLLVAVRGGGHNVAGNAVCDGGLVIDLTMMKGILVDPVKRTARAQPGAAWGDLDRETQLHGLVTPGGEVSTTGISGYTLSGGIGALHRKWGLACDNLLSVEIVTAAGDVLRASMTEHPDLFWAVRGGGGNFGVVTWFEYQLHPLGPDVYAAAVLYPFADVPGMLRTWRAFTDRAPDEVTSGFFLWSIPPLPDFPEEMHYAPCVIVTGMYAGPTEEGEAATAPLRTLAEPLADISGVGSYIFNQSAFDFLFPIGGYYYWKSHFLDALTDEAVEAIVHAFTLTPSSRSAFALRHMGGAISRKPEDASAYANRNARYNLSLDAVWVDSAGNQANIDWVRQAWDDLRPHASGGVYLNFAGLAEDVDALTRAGHGRNLERMRQIKRRYDPQNRFRGNVNIAP